MVMPRIKLKGWNENQGIINDRTPKTVKHKNKD